MPSIPAGLHEITTAFGCHHLLVENGGAVMIDTGLFNNLSRVQALFDRLDLAPGALQAILLTHGHIDHAGNAARLRDWSGAPILAHPAEQSRLNGRHPYRGWSRVVGALEMIARPLSGYRAVKIDRELRDGETLPWWGGLRVIHLPGHTAGHCGFWSERHQLLFPGDLVALWRWWSQYPPFFFNTEGARLPASLRRAVELRPRLVVPNHYTPGAGFDPELFAARLRKFAAKKLGPNSGDNGREP